MTISSIVIIYAICITQCARCFFRISRPTTSTLRNHLCQPAAAGCIEVIHLNQWGVFDQAEVNLTGQPLFAVITGETGAGKSVLMNALEYLCLGSTKRSLFRPGSETFVALQIGGNEHVKRTYNFASRRSFAEINGQKATVKSLTERMAGSVRFWSADSNSLRDITDASSSSSDDGRGFFSYLDSYIGHSGIQFLDAAKHAYVEWIDSYQNLQRLQSLERRMIQGNEAELLSFFVSELDAMEMKLLKLVGELKGALQDLESVSEHSSEEDTEAASAANEVGKVKLSPMQELLAMLGEGTSLISDGARSVDLRKCWGILLLADKVFNNLSRAMATTVVSRSGVGSGGPNRPSDIYDTRFLDSIDKSLQDYCDRLLGLQEGFQAMGLSGTSIDSRMEKVHTTLQVAGKSLRAAKTELLDVQKSLPDVGVVMNKIATVRAEWEGLARKHGGIAPPDLQRLRGEWKNDILSLSTMISTLPQTKIAEDAARKRYVLAATGLSKCRSSAATLLAEKVNALLPSLEMADKTLEIIIVSSDDPALEPTSSKVTAQGWDEVHLYISSRHTRSMMTDLLDSTDARSSVSTLSTGETARLSLALETCCLDSNQSFGSSESSHDGPARVESSGRPREGLVVYDEIDAHIGGEAAVSVARLLRSQGIRWQVVAITHNPVIAAAADVHFVVQRTDVGRDKRSIVRQIAGHDRETELARMATGRLDTLAGLDLAKALLSAFSAE